MIRRQAVAPLLLVATTGVCVVVAALLERPLWPAALGAGLVVGYWALEALAYSRYRRREFNGAMLVAVGGAVVRMVFALLCLVVIGLLARDVFAEVIFAFLAAFTVYLGARMYAFSGETRSATPQVRPR